MIPQTPEALCWETMCLVRAGRLSKEAPKTRGLADAEKPSAYVIVMDDARAKTKWPRCLDKPCVRLDPGPVTSTDRWWD